MVTTKTSVASNFEQGDKPVETDCIELIDAYVQHPNVMGYLQTVSTASSNAFPPGILTAIGTAAAGVLEIQSSTAVTGLPAGTAGRDLLATETSASARTVIDAQDDVITAQGDLVIGATAGTPTILTIGTTARFLQVSSGNPSWKVQIFLTNTTVFSATQTWNKPDGVERVFVTVVGAGGGGGAASSAASSPGAPGSGGETRMGPVDVTALTLITAVVGIRGDGTALGNGTDGGESSFGTLITAIGGVGGSAANAIPPDGGTGGTGGSIAIPGAAGQVVDNSATRTGNGGHSAFGPGGRGDANASGNAPVGGFGGGGAGEGADIISGGGGPGANGVVIVRW